MNDWEEEVEIVFEDFQKGFVTEQELREQIEEWGGSLIPEEEYEEVLMKMEQLIGEVEELAWEKELEIAFQMYEGDDKEYVS